MGKMRHWYAQIFTFYPSTHPPTRVGIKCKLMKCEPLSANYLTILQTTLSIVVARGGCRRSTPEKAPRTLGLKCMRLLKGGRTGPLITRQSDSLDIQWPLCGHLNRHRLLRSQAATDSTRWFVLHFGDRWVPEVRHAATDSNWHGFCDSAHLSLLHCSPVYVSSVTCNGRHTVPLENSCQCTSINDCSTCATDQLRPISITPVLSLTLQHHITRL